MTAVRDDADNQTPDKAGKQSEAVDLLSHDIRAAMSDVIGGLRLIESQGLDPAMRMQLERVRSSGEVLARLLEDALTSAFDGRHTTGRPRGQFNLARFLQDIDNRWTGRAAASGLKFHLTVDEAMPLLISTDRVALERILSNVLSNALKYTDKGAVTLAVTLTEENALRFSVRDEGPGFSTEALERLFQKRGRPEGAPKPGTGFGLHIAKERADAISGLLKVSNEPGRGARVWLDLPRAAWQTETARQPEHELPDLRGYKILVADDSTTNQLLAAQMLEALGAETQLASDGVEALNWLSREDFDLALIDIEMPRLNGLEVIRAIRAQPEALAEIPLVALTAYVLRANREAIYAAGADGIIAKPIMSIESFGHALVDYIGVRRDAAPDAMDPDVPVFDPARLDRLVEIAGPEGSPELLRRLETDLARVRDKLLCALKDKDHAAVRAETHVLISLAGAVGADGLHRLAAGLNAAAHRHDETAFGDLGPNAVRQTGELLDMIRNQRARVGQTL